jgi:hypothetical protein
MLLSLQESTRQILQVHLWKFGELPQPQPQPIKNDHPTCVKAVAFLMPLILDYKDGKYDSEVELKAARDEKMRAEGIPLFKGSGTAGRRRTGQAAVAQPATTVEGEPSAGKPSAASSTKRKGKPAAASSRKAACVTAAIVKKDETRSDERKEPAQAISDEEEHAIEKSADDKPPTIETGSDENPPQGGSSVSTGAMRAMFDPIPISITEATDADLADADESQRRRSIRIILYIGPWGTHPNLTNHQQ